MPSAALRAVLESFPDRVGGESGAGWFAWRGGDEQPDGSTRMRWCDYGPKFAALWSALRAANGLDDTDYMRWPALADYNAGRRSLAEAPRADIAKWLFAVYRQERFVEGLWADELANGRLKQAVKRLVELDDVPEQGV